MKAPIDFTIRLERAADSEGIRKVHRLAFGGEQESRLVDELRGGGFVEISLVAEASDDIVGHIVFSALQILTQSASIPALALAPLAVLPDFQRQGIGSSLMRAGMQAARERGDRIAIVFGDPKFYSRFGFDPELTTNLESPYAGEHWMACELAPGALQGITGSVKYAGPFGNL